MKKIILYIVLGFISFLGHAVESTDFVKKSAEQIDFLYARNKDIEEGRVHEKKWFIYFLGSDQPTLREYLLGIDTTKNKTFSSDYLDNLNNLLIEINKSEKVAMYVAVSDYNNPITVPLLPSGTSIQDKIQSLKEILKKPDGFTDLTGNQSSIDIDKGLKDYEKFQAFFSKKTEEIYNNSVLSKIGSDTNKRVLMPLSVFHYITIDNQKRKFYTLTIRSSKGDKEADEVVKEMRPLISGLTGKTPSEKKIESYVRAYLDYYSGNTGVTINSGGIKTTIKKDSELYKRAYGQSGSETDKEWSTTTQLLDFSGMLTPSDKKQIFKEIDFSRTLFNNMKMYVVLTDTNTSANILQNLNTLQPKKDQYYIWVHLNEDGTLSLSNLVPQDFNKKIAWATAHWTEVMWANAELNLGEGTVAHLKANLAVSNQLLTYASKILAIGIVPEEYWNPKHKDYPSYMPYIASAFNATMGDFGSVLNIEKAQMQFAFKTGIWNGVIDEVKGLADAGKMVTEYFLNPEKAREFDQGFSQLTFGTVWDSFKKAHGYEENQETNAFKLSHQLGKDIVFVASFFVGVGEVAALAKTGKLAKISTLANNMSKISRAVTGGVIKILKKMPPNIANAIKKLPDNIIKEVQKVGAKSYLILKLNTTKLAKISDDAVFSEMKLLQDGAIVKLTDGNNAVFDNVSYIDDLGKKTGTIAIVKNGDEIGIKINNAGGDVATLLVKYANIRKHLGNSRVTQYFDIEKLKKLSKGKDRINYESYEDLFKKAAHPDVLDLMNKMDEFEFAEMMRGLRDLMNNNKLETFEEAIKGVTKFDGQYGWLKYWNKTPGLKYAMTTILDLRKAGNLLPIGNATDIQLATIQAFTCSGDFINQAKRYSPEFMGEFAEIGWKHAREGFDELRTVGGRLIKDKQVFSGKAFSKAQFESDFMNGIGKTIEYKSFISTSKLESVAKAFTKLTKKWAGDGEKIAVVQRITTKNGVYIDDLSDWGKNLGPTRHSNVEKAIQIQEEVVLNPGLLKQIKEPIPIMENGVHKTIDGMKAYYVDFIEVVK